jgi:Patatin-like phospholipase
MRPMRFLFLLMLVFLSPIPATNLAFATHFEEELSMGLSLAGGGIRAAAFSFGVMIELEQIHICWEGTYNESNADNPKRSVKRIHKIVYRPPDTSLESVCYGIHIENWTDDISSLDTANLLEMMHDISAVSGSAQVASYYMQAAKTASWTQSFREKLQDINPTSALAARIDLRNSFHPWLNPLLRPGLLISSLTDNVSYIANFVFSPLLRTLDIHKIPDTSPFLIFGGTQGLIRPEDLAKVYDKWYFDYPRLSSKRRTLEDLRSVHKYTNLRINATDVRSHQIFSFDPETFRCMGLTLDEYKAFPLSLALAASSALPVIVSPHKFNPREIHEAAGTEKKDFLAASATLNADCHSSLTYSAHTSPVLMDGGIIDNLGLITLAQIGFWKKNTLFNKDGHPNPALKLFMISVNATVTGGSNLPVVGDDPLGKNLDQSFDVLMNDKTDVTRTIFETNLDTFGVGTLEFRFSDVLSDEQVISGILELQQLSRRKTDPRQLSQFSEELTAGRHSREEIVRALNSVGMAPTQEQIDLVILAGRASVASRFEAIKKALKDLDGKHFQEDCDTIMNLSKFYCWPTAFTTPGLLNLDQRSVLFKLHDERRRFLEKTIANRARRLKDIKDRLRERLIEQTESGFSPSPERMPYARPIFTGMCDKRLPFSIYGQVRLSGTNPSMKELQTWCKDLTSDPTYKEYTTNPIRKLDTQDWDSIRSFQERMLKKCSTDDNLVTLKSICKSAMYNSLSWLTFQFASRQSQLGASPHTRSFVREGFHYLHTGLHNDPDNIHLNSTLGLMLFTRLGAYRTGLSHIEKSIQLIESRRRDLLDVLPSSPQESTEAAEQNPLLEQLEGLDQFSRMLKLNYVRFFSLSPMSDGPIHPNDSGEEWVAREYGRALTSQLYHPESNLNSDPDTEEEENHDDCTLTLIRRELLEGFVPNTLLLSQQLRDSCRTAPSESLDSRSTKKELKLLAQKASDHQNHEARLASKYASKVFAEFNGAWNWNPWMPYEDHATYLLMGTGWKFCQDQSTDTREAIELLKKAKDTFLGTLAKDLSTESKIREVTFKVCWAIQNGITDPSKNDCTPFELNTLCSNDCVDHRRKTLAKSLLHLSRALGTHPYNHFSPDKMTQDDKALYDLLWRFDRSVFTSSDQGSRMGSFRPNIPGIRSLISQYESLAVKTQLAEHLECINN